MLLCTWSKMFKPKTKSLILWKNGVNTVKTCKILDEIPFMSMFYFLFCFFNNIGDLVERASHRRQADLCWVVGPLAIHIKLVLMLPFRKINNGHKGVLTLINDKGQNWQTTELAQFFFWQEGCQLKIDIHRLFWTTITFRYLKTWRNFLNKTTSWAVSQESC